MVNVTQRDIRSVGFMHRSNVTSPDVILIDPNAAIVTSTATTGGYLTGNLSYYIAYTAGIAGMGVSNRSIIQEKIVPAGTNTNIITINIPQVTNAHHYQLFFSTDTSPLWVGFVNETQRAAGAFIGAYGVTTSPSVLAAPGQVAFGVVGTGLTISDPVFDWSNAFILPTPLTPIICTGKTRADVYVKFTVTDARTKPYFIAVPFYKTEAPDSFFYAGPAVAVSSPDMVGGSVVRQLGTFDVSACQELLITIGGISGQNARADLWVELV
jgi:hypothetical protein